MSQLGRRGVKTLSRVAGSYLPRPRGLRLASTSTRGTTSMQASTSHADTDRHTHLSEISSPIRTTDRRRRELIDEILRVDHAGEYGAVRIYEGQLAVLGGGSKDKELLNHMKQQEEDHLRDVSHLLTERRARPTALLPFWNAAGYCLGVGTALLGREAAMACTVAVETAIGQHYDDQIRELLEKGYDEEELTQILKKNRDEELEHLNTGLENNAESTPLYQPLSNLIQTGCKAAIWMARRV
eukprot:gb/GECG01006234.1/.p1 GENE.gb/GECG01006234.1/~~gb/GECG01006234.1/.p1  ORF type:complete len:241 (+),score=33.41 gb/GECG01006234.1/:1-723(+)